MIAAVIGLGAGWPDRWNFDPLVCVAVAILAAVGTAAVMHWRLGKMRATNAHLEALVAARTEDLHINGLELVRAREAAEATDRARSAFLANMSHELRTPLNAILGYTQILLKDPELSARNRERVAVVCQSGAHLLSMIEGILDISRTDAGHPPESRSIVGFKGGPRRLLIADDEPINRRVLGEMLRPLGFDIEEADDGANCLEICERRMPDALLLDLRMPGLDGLEVARLLRRRAGGAAVRIIAVSASVFEHDRQHAMDAGCDDFVPKPFNENQLLDALGKALGLEWVLAGPALPPVTTVPAGGAPPPAELDAMLEFSRRGDILGIKKRLGAIRSSESGTYDAFVQTLEPLVAAYQMDRIRDTLLRFKEQAGEP